MRMAISASLALDQAELADGLAEGRALLGVFRRRSASTFFAPPMQDAPSLKRPMFRMLNAMMWPRPISRSRFSFGTWQFSKKIGAVELPLMPIFFSSAPDGEAGKAALDDEAGKFLAVHLGEDDEHDRRSRRW